MKSSQLKGIGTGVAIRTAIANKTGFVRGLVTGLFPPKDKEELDEELVREVARIQQQLEEKKAPSAEEAALMQEVAQIAAKKEKAK